MVRPNKADKIVMNLPIVVPGVMSPYPQVVIVTNTNHMLFRNDENFSFVEVHVSVHTLYKT